MHDAQVKRIALGLWGGMATDDLVGSRQLAARIDDHRADGILHTVETLANA